MSDDEIIAAAEPLFIAAIGVGSGVPGGSGIHQSCRCSRAKMMVQNPLPNPVPLLLTTTTMVGKND